jgi:pimeloyl-ACP methyl ester carboxylesterase
MARQALSAAPERFALAGLSMGGYLALEIVRQAPDRVARLALLDTSARPDTPDRTADRRRLIEVARAEGVAHVQHLLMPRLIHPDRLGDADLVTRVVRMAEDTGLDAFIRQQEAIIDRPDSRPLLPAIACATLVLVGAEDLQTPVEIAREMAGAIRGSRLEVIPHCGHLSTMERPDAVNGALAAWLER